MAPARSFLRTGGVARRMASEGGALIRMSAVLPPSGIESCSSTGIGSPQLATGVLPSMDVSFQQ